MTNNQDKRDALEQPSEFLIQLLENQYGKDIAKRIIEGYRCRRIVSLRVNPLRGEPDKTVCELSCAGIQARQVEWYRDAYVLPGASESDVRALDAYDGGRVYLQNLSSMLPPLILGAQEGTDVLDMAAAPGSKTTQIAALTSNRCRITACERSPVRAQRLKYNLDRQGVSCAYVMVTDSRTLSSGFSFDKILLDAPCSGSGTLSFDGDKLKAEGSGRFTKELIQKSVLLQRVLLAKALELLKTGGELVYSTCSVLEQENEAAVRWALSDPGVELVKIDEPWTDELPRLPSKLDGTICICPDGMFEGFFVAKLRKKAEVKLSSGLLGERKAHPGSKRGRRR